MLVQVTFTAPNSWGTASVFCQLTGLCASCPFWDFYILVLSGGLKTLLTVCFPHDDISLGNGFYCIC